MPLLESSENLIRAHTICKTAHAGQLDKAGQPYHLHPEYVAAHVEGEEAKIVALLHDVLEDTDYDLNDLREAFSPKIIEALLLLTHDPTVPYLEYIRAIKQNPLARAVKIADLQHNSMLSRLKNPTKSDYKRLAKYQEALKILT